MLDSTPVERKALQRADLTVGYWVDLKAATMVALLAALKAEQTAEQTAVLSVGWKVEQ